MSNIARNTQRKNRVLLPVLCSDDTILILPEKFGVLLDYNHNKIRANFFSKVFPSFFVTSDELVTKMAKERTMLDSLPPLPMS